MGGLRDEVGKWAHMPTSSKAGSAYQRDVFVIRGSLSSLQFLPVCPCGKAGTHSHIKQSWRRCVQGVMYAS